MLVINKLCLLKNPGSGTDFLLFSFFLFSFSFRPKPGSTVVRNLAQDNENREKALFSLFFQGVSLSAKRLKKGREKRKNNGPLSLKDRKGPENREKKICFFSFKAEPLTSSAC